MDVERATVPRVSQGNLVGECVLCFRVEFLGVRVDDGEVGRIFSRMRPSEISSQRRRHEFVALGRTVGATVQGRLEVLGQSNKGFNVHAAMIRLSAHAAVPTTGIPKCLLRLPPGRLTSASEWGAWLAGCLRQGPYRDEVVVIHVAQVVGSKGDQRLGPTRGGDELDLERVRSVDLHNCAKVTATKSSIRDVAR